MKITNNYIISYNKLNKRMFGLSSVALYLTVSISKSTLLFAY
jgi:hypothetical protein